MHAHREAYIGLGVLKRSDATPNAYEDLNRRAALVHQDVRASAALFLSGFLTSPIVQLQPRHTIAHLPMSFNPDELEIARQVFEVIVGDEPKRALALAPVVQWPTTAWSVFTNTMQTVGFDFRNPRHLTALQSLIDEACDS